jgi:benzoyl-CoA-dihydrodiol lyase
LPPLEPSRTAGKIDYRYVRAELDRDRELVTITVHGPEEPPGDPYDPGFWPLRMTRELDDLILWLRTNEPALGTWVIKTSGDADRVLAYEGLLTGDKDWLLSEIRHYYKRTLKRLDVTSRSLIALIEPGSCFAGALLELALACDRQYMFIGLREDDEDEDGAEAQIVVTDSNLGAFPMGNGLSRLATRFYGREDRLAELPAGRGIDAEEAAELGLVTLALDDIDFDDEVRIALEERAALSPDALTGLEANNRFAGPETMETKIFGRLSAWQNWIFTRPNATDALGRYGSGQRATFDRDRT